MTRDDDVPVPMRDGIRLVADVIRPDTPGRFPVLIAASPYPRQIQDLGAPFGFIEAGASDFFVPRGYGWQTSPSWPLPGIGYRELALCADGTLSADEGAPGQRAYMTLGAGLNRARPSQADPPSSLTWDTSPLTEDLEVTGNLELRLDATASASDTAWIVVLGDVGPDGTGQDVTAGYLRASLRAVDDDASQPGAPSLPCRSPQAVPVNEPERYRVPLVGTAYRFRAGHRLRLILTSNDQDEKFPAMMTFRHASVGTSSLNRIASSSRLVLPTPP